MASASQNATRRLWARPVAPRGLGGTVLLLTCLAFIAFWLLHPLLLKRVWPASSYVELLATALPQPALFTRLLVTATLVSYGLLVTHITRRAAERTLNQVAAEAQALFDGLGEPMACYDTDLRVRWANRAAATLAGREPDDLVGEQCHLVFHRSAEPCEGCPAVATLAAGEPAERVLHLPDGRVFRARSHALVGEDGGTVGVIEAAHDITALQHALEAAEERNALIEAMLCHLPVGVAIYQASTGQVRYANPTYKELVGWHTDDAVPVEALFRGVYDEPAYQREMRQRILSEMPRDETTRWRRVDTVDPQGGRRVVEMMRRALLPEDLVLALARDVTAEVQAERRLAASRAHYRQLVEALGEGVWLLDNDGITTYANPRLGELLGCTEHELQGRAIDGYVETNALPRVREALESLGVSRSSDELEVPLQRVDGATVYARMLLRPTVDDDGHKTGAIAAVADVTERRRLEDQVRRVSRMEAVGRLAAGVAHDFNSILQVINGTAELLLMDARDDHPWREDMSQILRAGREGAALTSQLRTLSREQEVDRHPVQLRKVVREREDLLRRLLPENVTLRVEDNSRLPLVMGDAVQLGQVLLNLVANARDAMPEDGGVVTVRTFAQELAEPLETVYGEIPCGRYACLAVSDTGVGIPVELQSRVFEPFFTTKQPDEGTGLGLSQVYGIARALGGHVTFASTPGVGTRFTVYLPAVADIAAAIEPASASGEPISGRETVLVVEDDPGVRTLAKRVLTRLGYRVLAAEGRRGALSFAREHGGRIDLLLADVVMPDANGASIARELAEQLPGLRTLFMSGYNRETLESTLRRCPETALLRKPFTAEQLAQAVRAALDAAPMMEKG